jgi:hypothetical protein
MTMSYRPTRPRATWRDSLLIHPAAELFPPMSPDELRALGEDIKKHGLRSQIVLWRADPKGQAQLLDGRSRLDGIQIVTGSEVVIGPPSLTAGKDFLALNKVIVLDKSVDPVGATRSCGCLRAETKSNLRHGHARKNKVSGTYRSWGAMLRRCRNPNAVDYPRYDGQGIKVCQHCHQFENFLLDLGERPPGKTLDRINNNNRGYSPGNTRWATPKQQANNRGTRSPQRFIIRMRGTPAERAAAIMRATMGAP